MHALQFQQPCSTVSTLGPLVTSSERSSSSTPSTQSHHLQSEKNARKLFRCEGKGLGFLALKMVARRMNSLLTGDQLEDISTRPLHHQPTNRLKRTRSIIFLKHIISSLFFNFHLHPPNLQIYIHVPLFYGHISWYETHLQWERKSLSKSYSASPLLCRLWKQTHGVPQPRGT